MAKKTPKWQDFKPADIEEEIALRAKEAVGNLVAAAALLNCPGDDQNYAPVTVLLCAMRMVRQPLEDSSELVCFFIELETLLSAAERMSDGPLHSYRQGLVACARTLCEAGRKVADGGLGLGENQLQTDDICKLLMPFSPEEATRLRDRAHLTHQQVTSA